MKQITFGISQLRKKTPDFIHWATTTGAALMTLLAGLQLYYPQYINDHVIAEFGKALAAFRLVGQFFGVQPVEKDPAQDKADWHNS